MGTENEKCCLWLMFTFTLLSFFFFCCFKCRFLVWGECVERFLALWLEFSLCLVRHSRKASE